VVPKLYHFLNPNLKNQNTWMMIWYCSLFWSISLLHAQLLYPPHLKRLVAHQNSAIETYHEKNSSTPSKKKLEYHIHFGLALNIVALKNIPVPVGCSWTAVHEPLIHYNLPQYKTAVLQNLKFWGPYLYIMCLTPNFQMMRRGKILIWYSGRYGIPSFKIGCMW